MGDGSNGRLGHGGTTSLNSPKPIDALSGVHITFVACGAYHSIAMDEVGITYAWGKNESGQLGLGHQQESNAPVEVEALNDKQIKHVRDFAEPSQTHHHLRRHHYPHRHLHPHLHRHRHRHPHQHPHRHLRLLDCLWMGA